MSKKYTAAVNQAAINFENLPAASLPRLLGSWLYDAMSICAVWILSSVLYLFPAQIIFQVDSSDTSNLSTSLFTGPVFYTYLFLISWFFFAWFWTHGGQTIGLKAWSLRLQTREGFTINWTRSLLRFFLAGAPWILALFLFKQASESQLIPSPYQYLVFLIGFIGLLWTLIDKENRSLQDYFSDTRTVKIPKIQRK